MTFKEPYPAMPLEGTLARAPHAAPVRYTEFADQNEAFLIEKVKA